MISRTLLVIYHVAHCSSKTFIVEANLEADKPENASIGSDYMNNNKRLIDDTGRKMVVESEKSVKIGESVNLRCEADSNYRIEKCFYYRNNDNLRFRSRPGASFEGGRITCLCDEKSDADPKKVCGLHIKNAKAYDAGEWRCEGEVRRMPKRKSPLRKFSAMQTLKISGNLSDDVNVVTPPPVTPPPGQLLLQHGGFTYFKVPSSSSTMRHGDVADACERVGAKAWCSGPLGKCLPSVGRCVQTPLSVDCRNPMMPVSKLVCNRKPIYKCSSFHGVFTHYNNNNYDCGNVNGKWCNHRFKRGQKIYALCVRPD